MQALYSPEERMSWLLAITWLLGTASSNDSPAPTVVDPLHPTTRSASSAPTHVGPFPFVIDIALAGRETISNNVPSTTLLVDPTSGLWLTSSLYTPQSLTAYPAGFLLIDGEIEFLSWLRLRVLLDTGEVRSGASLEPPLTDAVTANAQPFVTALTNTSMIREFDVQFSGNAGSNHFQLDLGKKRYSVAQGLLYDDFAVGVSASYQSHASTVPLRVEVAALMLAQDLQDPTPRSPFAFIKLEYLPSYFESVGLFAAYYDDLAGTFNDVLSSAIAEQVVVNDPGPVAQVALSRLFLRQRSNLGNTGYAGLTLHLLPVAGLTVRGAALLQRGSLVVSQTAKPSLLLNLGGWAATLSASYQVHPLVSISGFGFGLSGDQPPQLNATSANYNSYIGVAPYLTWTGLFFSGGLNQGFFSGRATASGVNGHGVAGAGLSCDIGNLEAHGNLRVVYLSALAAAPAQPVAGGGTQYGVEFDAVAEWSILSWLTVAGEFDVLSPGNFFPQNTPAWRALAQGYVTWGN